MDCPRRAHRRSSAPGCCSPDGRKRCTCPPCHAWSRTRGRRKDIPRRSAGTDALVRIEHHQAILFAPPQRVGGAGADAGRIGAMVAHGRKPVLRQVREYPLRLFEDWIAVESSTLTGIGRTRRVLHLHAITQVSQPMQRFRSITKASAWSLPSRLLHLDEILEIAKFDSSIRSWAGLMVRCITSPWWPVRSASASNPADIDRAGADRFSDRASHNELAAIVEHANQVPIGNLRASASSGCMSSLGSGSCSRISSG